MKHSFYFLVIFILSGCNGSEPGNSKFSSTVSENVPNTKTNNLNHPLNFKTAIDSFITIFLTEYDTLPFHNNESGVGRKLNQSDYTYVKRQLFKKREHFTDEAGKKYFKRFELIAYEYKDSASCGNAFESWLNNFGTTGFPIERGVNLEGIHTGPTYVICTKTQITALFMPCEFIKDEWEQIELKMKDLLVSTNENAEILENKCHGPLIWSK